MSAKYGSELDSLVLGGAAERVEGVPSPAGGAAATPPDVVVVGGAVHVVGGWVDAELTRRIYRGGVRPYYGARRRVSAEDAMASLVGGPTDPLVMAQEHAADTLERYERRQLVWSGGAGSAHLPGVSAACLRRHPPDADASEWEALAHVWKDVVTQCGGSIGEPPPAPALAAALAGGGAAATDAAAVRSVEARVAPAARETARYRGRLATFFDAAAASLDARMGCAPRAWP